MTKLIQQNRISKVALAERLRLVRPRTRGQLQSYVQAYLGLRVPGKRICREHDSPLDYLAYAVLGEDATQSTPDGWHGYAQLSHAGDNDNMPKPLKGVGMPPRSRTKEILRCAQNDNSKAQSDCPPPSGGGFKDGSLMSGGMDKFLFVHGEMEDHATATTDKPCLSVPPSANQDIIVWANRGGGKTQLGAIASLLECVFLSECRVRILGGSEEQSQRMYEYLTAATEHGYGGYVASRITSKGCRFVTGSDVQVLAQSDRSVRGQHVQRLRCDEVDLFDPDVWQAAQFVTQSRAGIAARLEAFSTMHRPYGLMQELIQSADANRMRVFRWCLWEVIEQCVDRNCSQCALWSDCHGRAKQGEGYYRIDDAIAQKRRSSESAWQSEMLCRQPNQQELVFTEFHPTVHVREMAYDANLPLYRTIDFGFSNPLACLFVQVDQAENVYVLDEHLKSRTILAEHARLIQEQYPYPVAMTYCDPAGRQVNEITGTSAVTELKALGIPTQSRSSRILDGIELIRCFLAPALGNAKLFISPKCEHLIRAFRSLRYQRLGNGVLSELPDKDGVHDHLIDALRYFFVNRFGKSYALRERKY
jgi:terminase large subunit-like protein